MFLHCFPISNFIFSFFTFKPLSDGYLAVVLPKLSEASMACSHLLTEDQFSKKKAEDNTEKAMSDRGASGNSEQSTTS